MKYLIALLFPLSVQCYAQSYTGDHSLTTTGILSIGGDSGLNLTSGNSVQIESGGDGNITLITPATDDIDVISGGNVVLWPSSGYNVQAVDGIQLQQLSSQPMCGAGTDGLLVVIPGGSGVADVLQVCMKAADDSYGWVTK